VASEDQGGFRGEDADFNMGAVASGDARGVAIVLELDGETSHGRRFRDVGYLHRGGMRKIAEHMTYTQFIPYTDRLDYLAGVNATRHALAVEKLDGNR